MSDASLDVQAGEFAGIIGPNGSGKSSLLKCVYRLNKQDKGIINLNENNIWDLSAKEFARLAAAVPQEMPGQFDFSVREIAAMGRYPHKNLMDRDNKRDNDLINNALNYVGMFEKSERMFSSLSGGEKQRISIARAIMKDAPIIVLDEATANVDPENEKELTEAIDNLTKEKTIIMIAHRLKTVRHADQIIVIDKGKIVQEISAEELEQKCRKYLHVKVTNAAAFAHVMDKIGAEYSIINDTEADLFGEYKVADLSAALSTENCELLSLTEHEESLENYFINLVGSDGGEAK